MKLLLLSPESGIIINKSIHLTNSLSGYKIQGAGCRMQDSGCRMQDSGCRVICY
jgi:hypothetical protein